MIPFCDLSRQAEALAADYANAFERVMRSGRFLFGPECEALEAELAAWHGVKHCVCVASGTDAIEIALRAQGIHSKSLYTSTMTAPATPNAIEASGNVPWFKDIDPRTRNATGCDVQVHIYGLAELADTAKVEDCAHAMGAWVNGKLAGTMGRCGALSFYPTKILGAMGDGGAVLTDSELVAHDARSIRHYGRNEMGNITLRGQNSRMSEVQAALLRVSLTHVDDWIARRRKIAERYSAELHGKVVTPWTPAGCEPVYHVYVIESEQRDELAEGLYTCHGIDTMQHYPRPIHAHARWNDQPDRYPHADALAKRCLSLPCYPYLTDSEQTKVINAVKELT